MKTKTILICLCFFTGIGLTSSYGQEKAKKTEQGWLTSGLYSPVFCGDTMVDLLEGGIVRLHYVVHYSDNAKYYEIVQIKGEVTSQTGEVFQIKETDKYYFTDVWYLTWHYNFIGNRGTHYIGTLTWNLLTGEITVGRTVCN